MSVVPNARRLALAALDRIEQGEFANRVLPDLLAESKLDQRDRALVTELVYGTTRMRRACDFVVDRFLLRPPDAAVRIVLRLGAYQLAFTRIPPHAAVSATVDLAPGRAKGFVNAVLRRVAATPEVVWPDGATRLSYPDWIVERLTADLGASDALGALAAMNEGHSTPTRADGYQQSASSQAVVAALEFATGTRAADLCAAPGGKATGLAQRGATVFATDIDPGRARRLAATIETYGPGQSTVVQADGRCPPWPDASMDLALIDAPCSGLGALGRRPDARWRITPDDIDRLVELQHRLVTAAVRLVRPGGELAYSVCTMTATESLGIDQWIEQTHPELVPKAAPGPPWRTCGRGARLLPQDLDSDGMSLFRYTR